MIDEDRLKAIKARIEEAPPGPWEYRHGETIYCDEIIPLADTYDHEASILMAHSREDLPWAVEQIETLRAEVVRLNQELRRARG